MAKSEKPVACKDCFYRGPFLPGHASKQNGFQPRCRCFCEHPMAKSRFKQFCPTSHLTPGLVGHSRKATPIEAKKGTLLVLDRRSSPKWCPLREDKPLDQ